jgi:hypothetical protein
MSDKEAREVYERAGLGQRFTLGERPAVLVVDFSCGFTDPESTLGSEMTAQVEATRRLLDRARRSDSIRTARTAGSGCRRRPRSPSSRSAGAGSRSIHGSTRATTRPSC